MGVTHSRVTKILSERLSHQQQIEGLAQEKLSSWRSEVNLIESLSTSLTIVFEVQVVNHDLWTPTVLLTIVELPVHESMNSLQACLTAFLPTPC